MIVFRSALFLVSCSDPEQDSIWARLLRLILNDGGTLFTVVGLAFMVCLGIAATIYNFRNKRRERRWRGPSDGH